MAAETQKTIFDATYWYYDILQFGYNNPIVYNWICTLLFMLPIWAFLQRFLNSIHYMNKCSSFIFIFIFLLSLFHSDLPMLYMKQASAIIQNILK